MTEATMQDGQDAPLETAAVQIAIAAVGLAQAVSDARPDVTTVLQGGREMAGYIVSGMFKGRHVLVDPLLSCQSCPYCLSGQTNLCPDKTWLEPVENGDGLSLLMTAPVSSLIAVPPEVPLDRACLTEPIARGWHAVRLARRAFPRGRNALIIGDDAVALGAALGLKAQGIDDVTLLETEAARAAVLRQSCDQTVRPAEDLPQQPIYDLVIDCLCTAQSRRVASANVRAGGVISKLVAQAEETGLDLARVSQDEITVLGSSAYTAQDFRDTAAAIFEGRLGALDWAEVRQMTEVAQAIEDLRHGRVTAPRLVLVANPSV